MNSVDTKHFIPKIEGGIHSPIVQKAVPFFSCVPIVIAYFQSMKWNAMHIQST